MAKISLSADDICRIIKQCQDSGIEDFKFQDLTFKFHPRRNEDAATPGQVTDSQDRVSEISQPNLMETKLADETSMLEAEEAQLMIDDPYGFERAQVAKHLELNRGRNDSTFTRGT
jgi:hypothetical protein